MKAIVTGSDGFLGRHLVSVLKERGHNVFEVRSHNYNLLYEGDTAQMYKAAEKAGAQGKVDIIYHLAALVGGIGANQKHPARFFYENMRMGMNVIHNAYLARVPKVVLVGSTCSYPKFAPIPFKEHSLFDGYPEETNAPYGIAKRALGVMLKAYQDEYGLRFAYLLPTNLFGPFDAFNEEKSHVIPALIKKFLWAKENNTDSVTVWGTGRATRDFLFVEDAAEAIALAGEKYDSFEPLNLGSGQELSIMSLACLIKDIIQYDGKIVWDTSKPDGQPRRCLDSKMAKHALGWVATTPMKTGLEKTIEWYIENR